MDRAWGSLANEFFKRCALDYFSCQVQVFYFQSAGAATEPGEGEVVRGGEKDPPPPPQFGIQHRQRFFFLNAIPQVEVFSQNKFNQFKKLNRAAQGMGRLHVQGKL